MNTPSAELLNDLLEVARDGERFYREAAERVRSPELQGTFRQMAELRQRLMDDLAEHVVARGERPSDQRTLRGASQQAYAGVRAALSGDDDQVWLAQLESVEDRLLDRYERALAAADAEPDRQVLRRHLLAVRAAHDRMQLLRDQGLAA